ncbi:hypothetical protein YC2023_100530 [Brassica napus]
MERERGREIVGEGSSMSSREQRNLREQERRMRMKHLFNILSSYVSPTHRVHLSTSVHLSFPSSPPSFFFPCLNSNCFFGDWRVVAPLAPPPV